MITKGVTTPPAIKSTCSDGNKVLGNSSVYGRVRELDLDLKAWPFVWVGNTYLPARRGEKCRVRRQAPPSVGFFVTVEFEDGFKAAAHSAYIRKRPTR